MPRSELVTVPFFSAQASAGRRTRQASTVSDARIASETMESSQAASASRTASALGRLATGLVAMIHTALTRPARTASNSSTAFRPALRGTRLVFQKRPTRPTSSSAKSMCAASVLESAPTSRPPMALGWPVIEKGPMPGRPMRPVSRWQLIRALTLSTPALDWFTPWE